MGMLQQLRLKAARPVVYFAESDWRIAPTQPVPVIRQNPKEPIRELSLMHQWTKTQCLLCSRWSPHSD